MFFVGLDEGGRGKEVWVCRVCFPFLVCVFLVVRCGKGFVMCAMSARGIVGT